MKALKAKLSARLFLSSLPLVGGPCGRGSPPPTLRQPHAHQQPFEGCSMHSLSSPVVPPLARFFLCTGEAALCKSHATFGTGEAALGTGEAALGTGQAALGTGEAALGTGEAALGTGEAALVTGEAALGTDEAVL
ncbi:hypothetical protein AB205_0119330, partial [Aquarana catesbeiana]